MQIPAPSPNDQPMQNSSRAAKPIGRVALHLIDPASGRLIKSWTFTDQAHITIGRSPDQDVEMSDPYISRNHANLVHRDGQWMLVSLGRHGVLVANQLITEVPVDGELSFRLGAEGPTMRFRTKVEVAEELLATMNVDTIPAPVFELDQAKLEEDVNTITSGNYFQSLKQRAQQLRQRHRRN